MWEGETTAAATANESNSIHDVVLLVAGLTLTLWVTEQTVRTFVGHC